MGCFLWFCIGALCGLVGGELGDRLDDRLDRKRREES